MHRHTVWGVYQLPYHHFLRCLDAAYDGSLWNSGPGCNPYFQLGRSFHLCRPLRPRPTPRRYTFDMLAVSLSHECMVLSHNW